MSLQMMCRKAAGLAALVALAACAESPTSPGMEAPDGLSYAKLSDFQCKSNGWARSFTSTGASFSSQKACTTYAKTGGVISTLEILNSRLGESEGTPSWFLDIRGINLEPGSIMALENGRNDEFDQYPALEPVRADGFGRASFSLLCNPVRSWGSMHAVAVLPGGITVRSTSVASLCPGG